MKRLFGYFLLFLFTASPLQAALIVTSEWASVELNLAFEEDPAGVSPSDYDDLLFSDSYAGGIEFDMEIHEEGDLNGYPYLGYAVARGFKDRAPTLYPTAPIDNPVFGTVQLAERGDFETGEYARSLIDAVLRFTVTGADANSSFMRLAEFSDITSDFTYTLCDLTLGTEFVAPDALSVYAKENVTLLEDHDYMLTYHSLRVRDDGTNQFNFFTDTNVIYATTVPAPPGLLLFVSGLLGLGISRKRR